MPTGSKRFVAAAYRLLILGCCVLASQEIARADEEPGTWSKIGEDLELAQVSERVNPFLSTELIFIRSSLKRYRISVIKSTEFGWRRNTTKALGIASRAVVAINANFFDEQGRALGLIISRGIINQGIHRGGSTLSGIFEVSEQGLRVMGRDEFDPHGVTEAVQAGPRLVSKGSRVRGLRERSSFSKRSGVCVDAEKRLLIYGVSSGFLGISIEQLQDVLLRPEIGCVDALNLDGGGSAQLWVSDKVPGAPSDFEEISIQGSDPIPVALALVPRDSQSE